MFTPAEFTQTSCAVIVSIEHDDVVVRALLMGLQLEVVEGELNSVAGFGCEMPHTVFPTGVEVGPVRAADFTVGVGDLMLTAACQSRR